MSIFSRFSTMVKSWLNFFIGKAEDPEKMLNQMVLEMQEQLISAKRQVAIAIADEKRLSKQYQDEVATANEWERKAMLAVSAGNDSLAQQALERQSEHAQLAQGYSENWTAQKNAVENLKTALTTLNDKVEEARRKKNLLVARAKRAEAQQTIATTMSSLSQNNALDSFNRMSEKIDQIEAEASATTELAGIEHDDLSKQFKDLERLNSSSASSDALAALKAKMGMPSAARQLTNDEVKVEAVSRSNTNIKID